MAQPKPTADQLNLTNANLPGDPMATTPAVGDNDTSIATTGFVKSQGYAPTLSPSFTGNPTAPTQSPGNNSTRLATTAFVLANAGTPSTGDVLTAIAGASALAVGTYAFATKAGTGFNYPGDTVAGSSLTPIAASGAQFAVTNFSGTWRCMGFSTGSSGYTDEESATLWMRIS